MSRRGSPPAVGNQIEARIDGPQGRRQLTALGALIDDRASVRTEARLQIVARRSGDLARTSAAARHDVNLAEPGVGPAHEDELTAVAGPGGKQLERAAVVARQRFRRPAGDVSQPQTTERLEHDAFAVGRDRREANHLRVHFIGRDGDFEARRRDRAARVADMEGNVADTTREQYRSA